MRYSVVEISTMTLIRKTCTCFNAMRYSVAEIILSFMFLCWLVGCFNAMRYSVAEISLYGEGGFIYGE